MQESHDEEKLNDIKGTSGSTLWPIKLDQPDQTRSARSIRSVACSVARIRLLHLNRLTIVRSSLILFSSYFDIKIISRNEVNGKKYPLIERKRYKKATLARSGDERCATSGKASRL